MSLLAGSGVKDISPEKPVPLYGFPGGERISTGVHDPLLACALCLDNQGQTVILIALDVLFIDPETVKELRQGISSQTGVREENVFISCTHTHSGPLTTDFVLWKSDTVIPQKDPDYMCMFTSRIIAAAVDSYKNKQPAEIAWTTADARGVGGNRLSENGLTDPETGILAVRGIKDKKMIALSVVYGMHPTVLHEDTLAATSDFPGYTRQYLKDKISSDLNILYHTGPAGDQSPRYYVKGQTFEEAQRLGTMLGEKIYKSIISLTDNDFSTDAEVYSDSGHVKLPAKKFPSLKQAREQLERYNEEYETLKANNAGHGPIRTAECALLGAKETVALALSQEKGELDEVIEKYSLAGVKVIKIGNCYLIGLPCEIFVKYGLMIKEKSPLKTFVVSLVNGELQGYIVTPEIAEQGGYEANNSLFKAESGNLLVDKALAVINKLEGK